MTSFYHLTVKLTFSFNAAKNLADYLHFLDQNEAEYRRYFDWRYQPSSSAHLYAQEPLAGWCGACEKLVLNDVKSSPTAISKSYEDIHSWWFKEANCKASISPIDTKYSNFPSDVTSPFDNEEMILEMLKNLV